MSSNAAGTTAPRARIIKFKLPSIKERKRKRLVYSSETLVRSVRFMRYCLVCSASLFRAMAPWGLAMAEVAAMLLLYFVAVPSALVVRQRLSAYSYGFDHSLEDVVMLSLARGLAVTVAYFTGAGAKHHRPYMWTAYAFAAFGGPFVLAKLLAFSYPQHSATIVLVLLISLAFTCLHLTAAHNMVRWARHRSDMGLDGFGYPWEEGEEAWVMLGRTGSLGAFGPGHDDSVEDVSPHALADPDSQFIECGAMTVHVKEAAPPAGEGLTDVGIVLIHGYGSGLFAWRHIMWPLARATRCRVLAFDRPAFGLTSRPRPPTRGDSPYSLRSAARLALALAGQLGIKRVIFVGHADGALVALLATALAAGLPAGWTGGDGAADSEDDGDRSSGSSAFGSSGAAAEHGSSRCGTPESLPGSGGALRRSGGSGLWRKVLGGAGLAPLAEQSEADLEAGIPLMPPSTAGSGSLDASSTASRPPSQQAHRQQRQHQQQHPPQSQHREAPEPAKTPMAAGPPSTLAPAFSGANLKLRGAVPGGAVLAIGAAAGHAAMRHMRSDSQTSTVTLTASSGGKSSGSGVPGTPLTVLVVPEPGSDTATVSEDLADDCGLYSPMLSPRQRGTGGSGRSSSAEDLSIEMTSPTARSSDFFAPPAELRAPTLSPGDDDWRGLLTDAGGGGGHYFDTGGPRPEPLGLALLHPSMAGVLGPPFTRLLAKSKLGRRMLRPLLRSEVGEVSNRRAWHEPAKLTAEVLEHYKRPLRARNWDAALVEVSRLPREVTERQLAGLCGAAARLPTAVATGAHDRMSPAPCAAQLAADLGAPPPAILPACGHLSHEEAPEALLEFLTGFVGGCLAERGGAAARGELQYSGG